MDSPVKIWRRQKVMKDRIGKEGQVVAYTKIHIAGVDFKSDAPYYVVMVEFEGGRRVFGQLVDKLDAIPMIGMKVVSILRRVQKPSSDGAIAYGLKFKSA